MFIQKNTIKRLNDLEAQVADLTKQIAEIINNTKKPTPRKKSGKLCSVTAKLNQSSQNP